MKNNIFPFLLAIICFMTFSNLMAKTDDEKACRLHYENQSKKNKYRIVITDSMIKDCVANRVYNRKAAVCEKEAEKKKIRVKGGERSKWVARCVDKMK